MVLLALAVTSPLLGQGWLAATTLGDRTRGEADGALPDLPSRPYTACSHSALGSGTLKNRALAACNR